MKEYKFALSPVKWRQGVILFNDCETIVQLLLSFVESLKPDEELVQPVKRFFEQKIVPTIVNMVLKPYVPLWKRIIPGEQPDPGTPIKYMSIADVQEVLRDFFFLNRSSIENLATTANGFGINLSQVMGTMETLVQSPPTSSSIASPKATKSE